MTLSGFSMTNKMSLLKRWKWVRLEAEKGERLIYL
jgi:hypothetical protein